jgi:hypothetical protein
MHKQTAMMRRLIANGQHGNPDAIALIRNFVRGYADSSLEPDLLRIAQFLHDMRSEELRREAQAN